jgi:hypothetical protein
MFSVIGQLSATIRNNRSQSYVAPIARHNRITIMTAPTSVGCRGMGTKIGAGLSGNENRPRFYSALDFKNI